ncbi:hypothetical protein CPHO_04570 [Corynebacterium phocae]|uniref:Uncharacterized protein n=1 Tax=Corynebacterium phocae TaxID=161895 RepID=A0A1L7D2B2_9CORY|nr:hypothetical protein [Corynebacterium phocae]APT92285.1 hypothetical protein CPHO_04570 [Corynebacterium phocae]KAA8725430.1 hypothetical protein F4V58_04110 [Corynebacterium phocae]
MSYSPTLDIAGAFTVAALVPCLALVACGALIARRESLATTPDGCPAVTLRRVFGGSVALGAALGLFSLAPASFAFVIIFGSGVFGVTAAGWAWNAYRPVSAAFVSVAGLMLGVSLTVTLLVIASEVIQHTGATALTGVLVAQWLAFAVPGLAMALFAGGLKKAAAPKKGRS